MDNSRYRFGQWWETEDGALMQIVYVPHHWVKPGDPIPACPDCGTPFKKTREYPGTVGYEANCLELHDPELSAQSHRLG